MTAGSLDINTFQKAILASYRAVRATGVIDTTWGRALFEKAYWLYKVYYEAGPVHLLRGFVRPKTTVVDVGAHIGFFTLKFASWVGNGGRVIALEPEPVNCEHLRRAVAQSPWAGIVEIVQAAATDIAGEGRLELSTLHPGDHCLGTQGVIVDLSTVDDLMAARGWPEVSLIKIDVQGAEARVLAGASETMTRCRPALFLEVDGERLSDYGSSASGLLTEYMDRGYTVHALGKGRISAPLTLAQALVEVNSRAGTDVLLLPVGGNLEERAAWQITSGRAG